MAKKKPKPIMQPFPRKGESIGKLVGRLWQPVFIGDMSPELEQRITEEVVSNIDSLAVEVALRELCEEFCLRLTDSSMQAVGYRAITGVVRLHNQNPVNPSEMTEVAIRLLPHSLSEVVIGLAVVHADWRLVVHAPALTYFAQLISFRKINSILYLDNKKLYHKSVPSESSIRESKEFAYALGRVVRECQTIAIPACAEDDMAIAVGNAVVANFVEYYEFAIRGWVKFDECRFDVEDGLGFVANLHEAMQYGIGREAAEPSQFGIEMSAVDFQSHPAIIRGLDSQKALDDAQQRDEFRHMLVNALACLSTRQLQAWYFRFVVRLSDEAAAHEMNVRKTTFRTHVDRAISHFQMREYAALVCRVAHCTEDSKRFLDLVSLHLSRTALAALASPLPHCGIKKYASELEAERSSQAKGASSD